MNLQTFVYNGRYHSSIVKIIYYGKIKILSIMNIDLTAKYWVEDLIPRFGFLERLIWNIIVGRISKLWISSKTPYAY